MAASDDARPTRFGRGALGWVNGLLGILVLALVAVLVLTLTGGVSTSDEEQVDAIGVVRAAGADFTRSFLTVDYRRMDQLTGEVRQRATGQFLEEYSARQGQLKAAVEQVQGTAGGKVLQTGVSDLDADSAVVFVAADGWVRNKGTNGERTPRYYRLQVDLAKVRGTWLVNKLQFVN